MGGKSFSAGGVVLNTRGEVLVVNQNNDSWSLPKGHIDPGETTRQAAEREIGEESGIHKLQFVRELGSYERHIIGRGGKGEGDQLKHITMFLYRTDQLELRPEDPHNPIAKWIKPDQVAVMLTHPKDQAFYESVLPEIKSAAEPD
jgi:8-oxo-dGTP pyrophosphatase MutT (NUDIX family)